MKIKTIKLSDIARHPNFSLSAKDYLKESISVKSWLSKELQRFLDLGEDIDIYKEKIGKDETLHTFTVVFEDGMEADIKVCSSETGCYIDPVLFYDNGGEACVGEVGYTLLDEYHFQVDNKVYIVNLIAEED